MGACPAHARSFKSLKQFASLTPRCRGHVLVVTENRALTLFIHVAATTLEEKLQYQKEMRSLEGQRNAKRRALFDAQDEIDRKREKLINEIEGKMRQQTRAKELFHVRWIMA